MRALLTLTLVGTAWVLLIQDGAAAGGDGGTRGTAQAPTGMDLLLGPAPGAAPLLSRVPFGSSRAEVERNLPRFDRVAGLSTLADVSIIPAYSDGKLDQLWMNCRDNRKMLAALPRLGAAWGEPERLVNPIGPVLIWLDRGARVRLEAQIVRGDGRGSHCNLFLQPYTPLIELTGEEPGVFSALRKQPLLGASTEQLRRVYGRAFDPTRSELSLGATEWDKSFVIKLRFAADRVVGYEIHFLSGGNVSARAAGEGLLRAVLGPLASGAKEGRTELRTPDRAVGELWRAADFFRLEITAPAPR